VTEETKATRSDPTAAIPADTLAALADGLSSTFLTAILAAKGLAQAPPSKVDPEAAEHIRHCLLAPFPEYYIGWKLQHTMEDRKQGLAVCYVDARAVQDRLDDVFGVEGWTEEYTAINGGLLCTLRTLWPGGVWVTKQSFGAAGGGRGPDVNKSSESDALKRAAVKLGVFRYGYRIPAQWVPIKKRGKGWVIAARPMLEQVAPWALPRSSDGLATDVPYWELDEFAAHVSAYNEQNPPPEPPEPPEPKAKTTAGRDPATLIEQDKGKAKDAAPGQQSEGAAFVLRDSDDHPVPADWNEFYARALDNQELGHYKAKAHIYNAVRRFYPGFNVRKKADRQPVTIKQAWDVLRFRTLSDALQAKVLEQASQTAPGRDSGTNGHETGQTAAQDAPWTADHSENGAVMRYHKFLAKAHIPPAEATALLGVKHMADYTGSLADAVITLCEAKGITYTRTDTGLNVEYPPAD